MQNNGYIWGVIIAIILIIGAFFLFRAPKASAPGSVASSTASTGSTSPQVGGQMATSSNGQVHATGTLSGTTDNPPTLTGSIIIAPTVSADQAAQLQTKEATLITQLKAAPTRVDLWLELGMYRKEAGDYAGAIAAWNYVAQAGPSSINYIAYGNLGDLYQNFDTNYPLAETNYKAAIAIDPTVVDYYTDLYYLYGMENNPAAQSAILAQGLKANPNNSQLIQLQQQINAKAQ
jgi:hypothetical protein